MSPYTAASATKRPHPAALAHYVLGKDQRAVASSRARAHRLRAPASRQVLPRTGSTVVAIRATSRSLLVLDVQVVFK